MHEAFQPIIEDGRGIFPEDFRVKAPLGFKAAVRAAAEQQHMTGAEYARRAVLRSLAMASSEAVAVSSLSVEFLGTT